MAKITKVDFKLQTVRESTAVIPYLLTVWPSGRISISAPVATSKIQNGNVRREYGPTYLGDAAAKVFDSWKVPIMDGSSDRRGVFWVDMTKDDIDTFIDAYAKLGTETK